MSLFHYSDSLEHIKNKTAGSSLAAIFNRMIDQPEEWLDGGHGQQSCAEA